MAFLNGFLEVKVNILRFFRNKEKDSALQAKERLQVIIAHERLLESKKDFLPDMQRDIISVIKKYLVISQDDVCITIDNGTNCSVLELNIQIPEKKVSTS